MLLEHDAAIDFFISPLDHKEMSASDVGSGGALCALSGLPLEAEGSRESGWLYREVFAKSPQLVLDEALRISETQSADQAGRGPSGGVGGGTGEPGAKKAGHPGPGGWYEIFAQGQQGGRVGRPRRLLEL